MSSQFKRKKPGVSKDKTKNSSMISASKRLTSTVDGDLKADMEDIEMQNANILGSLIGETQGDKVPEDIVKRVELSQRPTGNRESKLVAELRSDVGNVINKGDDESGTHDKKREAEDSLVKKRESIVKRDGSPVINMNKSVNREKILPKSPTKSPVKSLLKSNISEEQQQDNTATNDDKEQITQIVKSQVNNVSSDKDITINSTPENEIPINNKVKTNNTLTTESQKEVNPPDPTLNQQPLISPIHASNKPEQPKFKQYGDNSEISLLILTLESFVKSTIEENARLKKKNLEFELKEPEYLQLTRELAAKCEELEIQNELANEQPSEHIKIEIDDLGYRLKIMDDNLSRASGENSQDQFIDDVIARNKEYNNKTTSNSLAMKKLKDNLANLRNTLTSITSK